MATAINTNDLVRHIEAINLKGAQWAAEADHSKGEFRCHAVYEGFLCTTQTELGSAMDAFSNFEATANHIKSL